MSQRLSKALDAFASRKFLWQSPAELNSKVVYEDMKEVAYS
jgi:hypothetical protein